MTHVGTRTARREDGRLLRGQGRFVDDVDLVGQTWLRVVRSTVAHARIVDVDVSRARAHPGARAVLIGEDVDHLPPIPMRLRWTTDPLDDVLQPVIARERVRYVGEPVAVVVADDPYVAEDLADMVEVTYDPLPPVLDATAAVAPDAPSLWNSRGNEVAALELSFGDVDTVFAEADEVVELDLHVGRHSGIPMETRGLLADFDRARGHLRVWGSTKVVHFNRRVLADFLQIPLQRIHFLSTDAGGGFGIRGEFYPEDLLVPYLARVLERPVKWVEDRVEHLTAANHSRQQRHKIAAAFSRDGDLLGLRDEIWHDNGAYLRTHGVTVPELTINMLPGPYRIEHYHSLVHVVTTNKTPAGTYRGPGRYEGTFAREHLFNVAAERLGVDAAELRRRNLLRRDEMPHRRPGSLLGTDMVLQDGDYLGLLDAALDRSGFADWTEEARTARAEGRMVGTGLAFFMEKSGLGPYETAKVEVDPSGAVRVLTGGASLGQGIETVLAQIAADELHVDPSEVEVIHGDTDVVPDGVGSWASRSTVVGGSAVLEAARATAEQAKRVAAELLGVSQDKVVLGEGQARVERTSDRAVSLGDVAAAAADPMRGDGSPPEGLGQSYNFHVDHMNYPYGVHLAQVEIDPASGGVTVLRYFVAYEIGRAINPQLVQGQLVGGVAQGIGGALFEEFVYDEGGQPQATTFMDYLLPTVSEMPPVGTLVAEDAPPVDNPLGAMGAGEGGTTGCGAALADAVEDALQRNGAVDRLPMTPARLRALIDGNDR